MKKTFSRTLLFIAATALLALTGCQQEIFSSIREEIALEDSTVRGDIRSIVRYKAGGTEYLFLDNGDIYYKETAKNYYDSWIKDANAPNDYTYKVAADSTYLYAIGCLYKSDNDGKEIISKKNLYYKSSVGGAWTQIGGDIDASTVATLFCTNTPQVAHRKAYVRIGSTVYSLNGGTITAATSTETTNGAGAGTVSCVYFNPSGSVDTDEGSSYVYFFDHLAAATNETSTTLASHIYYASGDTFYYSTDASTYISHDMDCDTIYNIAVTSNYFVLGTSGGLQEAPNSIGIPTGKADDDFKNAASTLSSSYEVYTVFAVNPSETETNTAVYASALVKGTVKSSSALLDNNGLWAYYPSRGNWNRE